MIFSKTDFLDNIVNVEDPYKLFESEKERNLYYKFFAGYFFNELIKGYEERYEKFFDLIRSKAVPDAGLYNSNAGSVDEIKGLLQGFRKDIDNIHVSFDYHAYLRGYKKDKGEMSDMVLFCDRGFISVEVKFLSDWKHGDDIESVQDRMRHVFDEWNTSGTLYKPLQVLLITKEKYKNVKSHEKTAMSNYKWIKGLSGEKGEPPYPIIIITWEEMRDFLDPESPVFEYLNKQLKRIKTKHDE